MSVPFTRSTGLGRGLAYACTVSLGWERAGPIESACRARLVDELARGARWLGGDAFDDACDDARGAILGVIIVAKGEALRGSRP